MTNIFTLTVDVILYLFRFLDMQERIAFAFSCERFRRLCVSERVFRKVDLSGHPVEKTQQSAICKVLRDKQLTQQITELNISNCRVFNWQIDDQLEEFIMFICPHLEALHVVNCGMRFQRLHRILQNASKLTSLSWSVWDFTSEDVELFVNSIESRSTQTSNTNSMLFTRNSMSSDVKSTDEISLKNIKRLHLETFPSKPQIRIVKYLVLSCCKDLEELEIYSWQTNTAYCTSLDFPLRDDQMNPSTSIADVLEHLHSLTVVALGTQKFFDHYREELRDFISSVVRKKSRKTKWRKLWIVPPIGIHNLQDRIPLDYSLPLHEIQPHELQSIEEITAHAYWSSDEMDKLKILFQSIRKNTVRSLHLCQPLSEANSIIEIWEPILMVGGHALKFLSLSFVTVDEIPGEITISPHTLFDNCLNITELDLLYCRFEKDICEPLSELKHLTKVQLSQCAISSKYNENNVEISKANLFTFMENCKSITHLDVRGCDYHKHFSCRLTDDDLLALAKMENLISLTLYNISGITEWTFLQNISGNCKFLAMLRIADTGYNFNVSHIPTLLASAKFLKHLAIDVEEWDLQSEDFWNLLSHAKNLERLCITCYDPGLINISAAVETLKNLPQLHALHLHTIFKENVEVFYNQIEKILEEEKCRVNMFFNTVLPINVVELCHMRPILAIPRL